MLLPPPSLKTGSECTTQGKASWVVCWLVDRIEFEWDMLCQLTLALVPGSLWLEVEDKRRRLTVVEDEDEEGDLAWFSV